MIDKLIEKIEEKNNPSVVGIDTDLNYLPDNILDKISTLEDAAKYVLDFNIALIDGICKAVPAVKVQIAYYEMLGVEGYNTFKQTLAYAKAQGLITIADAKRNDIGSTASAYSKAFLGEVRIKGKSFTAFESDMLTVNGYLGIDGVKPFIDDCKNKDKSIFVLVKTSNASSGQLQDLTLQGGNTVYQAMSGLVKVWGADSIGKYGYSDVGAVVGATHPQQAEILRSLMPNAFFLVPGYGAQGGTADDLKVCFDHKGRGAIVNSSRGIICAYKTEKYKGLTPAKAALEASLDMQKDINKAIGK